MVDGDQSLACNKSILNTLNVVLRIDFTITVQKIIVVSESWVKWLP